MANGWGGARANSGPKSRKRQAAPANPVEPPAASETEKPDPSKLFAQPKKQIMSADSMVQLMEMIKSRENNARQRPRTFDWCPFKVESRSMSLFPPRAMPAKDKGLRMAQDSALVENNQFATQQWMNGGLLSSVASEGLLFLGYPYLSELAQRPEFRLFGEIRAEEMTRKWTEHRGTRDESTKSKSERLEDENDDDIQAKRQREHARTDKRNQEIEKKIKELEDFEKDLKVRDWFKAAAAQDSFFGISHLYIDTRGSNPENLNDPELRTDIGNGRDKVTEAKFGGRKNFLRGLRVIEPMWCYPTGYNSQNPLSSAWYDPEVWYVMGTEIHKTRLLTFIGRPVPDILKPAYAFGGLSMTQMAQPYVDIWLRTRESVGEMIHAFSVMNLQTNLSTTTMPGGSGEGNGDVLARMMLFLMMRDNQGLFITDKNTEDFKNISAPLGGLDELQAQAQEHLFSVGRIPAVKFSGIQPKGLNATSEGEMRAFNDTIHGSQEHLYRTPLQTVYDLMQISLWGKRDPDITYDFKELHELTAKEKSEVRKLDAETDQIRIDSGVVSQEEVRRKVANDPESGFDGLDPDDVPDLMEEEEAGLEPNGGRPQPQAGQEGDNPAPRPAPAGQDGLTGDDWQEGKHPRDPDGKFASGGGGSGKIDPKLTKHFHEYESKEGGHATSLHIEKMMKAYPEQIPDIMASAKAIGYEVNPPEGWKPSPSGYLSDDMIWALLADADDKGKAKETAEKLMSEHPEHAKSIQKNLYLFGYSIALPPGTEEPAPVLEPKSAKAAPKKTAFGGLWKEGGANESENLGLNIKHVLGKPANAGQSYRQMLKFMITEAKFGKHADQVPALTQKYQEALEKAWDKADAAGDDAGKAKIGAAIEKVKGAIAGAVPVTKAPSPAAVPTKTEKQKAPQASPAELAQAKKTTGFYANQPSPKANEIIKEFNDKYQGKEITGTEDLNQKVADFKQMQVDVKAANETHGEELQAAAAVNAAKQKEKAAKVAKELAEANKSVMADLGINESQAAAFSGLLSMIGGSKQDLVNSFKALEQKAQKLGLPISGFEAAVIAKYSDGGYAAVNEAMRQKSVTETQYMFMKQANKALSKMPKHTGVVNRGTSLTEEQQQRYVSGNIIEEDGLTSTSTGGGFGGNTKFVVTAKGQRGANIQGLSHYPGEQEVLFMAKTQFKVTKTEGKPGGNMVIHMEEYDDQWE